MRASRHLIAMPAVLGLTFGLAACTGGDPAVSESPRASSTPAATASSTGEPSASVTPTPDSTVVATDPAVSAPAEPSEESRAVVDVIVTRAGIVEDEFIAGGYAEGIVETDGLCTLTLTSGSQSVSAGGQAEPSATSTDCGAGLSVAVSELASGEWTFVLTYSSSTYEGTSDKETVEIP